MNDIPELPSSVSEWKKAAESEGLVGVGINDEHFVRARRLSYRQFLPLRIIWKDISAASFDPNMFDLDEWMGRAADVLKDYQSWHTYNRSFHDRPTEGNFALASVFQAQARRIRSENFGDKVVFRNGSAPSSSGDSSLSDDIPQHELEEWAQDEDKDSTSDMNTNIAPWNRRYLESEFEPTIKNALVLFLTALTMSVPDLGVEWVMSGKTLLAKFEPGVAQYKVHVDAFMKGKNYGGPRVLVDVREPARLQARPEIRIQESAQMVAWLVTSPDRSHPRIIISQDEDEIFLIFAEYSEPYMRYLDSAGGGNANSNDPESFLTMYEVGPFNTNYQSAMSKVGTIILALVLRDAQYTYRGRNMDGRIFPQGPILFGDLTEADMYGPYQTVNTLV